MNVPTQGRDAWNEPLQLHYATVLLNRFQSLMNHKKRQQEAEMWFKCNLNITEQNLIVTYQGTKLIVLNIEKTIKILQESLPPNSDLFLQYESQ